MTGSPTLSASGPAWLRAIRARSLFCAPSSEAASLPALPLRAEPGAPSCGRRRVRARGSCRPVPSPRSVASKRRPPPSRSSRRSVPSATLSRRSSPESRLRRHHARSPTPCVRRTRRGSQHSGASDAVVPMSGHAQWHRAGTGGGRFLDYLRQSPLELRPELRSTASGPVRPAAPPRPSGAAGRSGSTRPASSRAGAGAAGRAVRPTTPPT